MTPLQNLTLIVPVMITLVLVAIGCYIIVCVLCAYIHIHGQKISCNQEVPSVTEAQDSGKILLPHVVAINCKYPDPAS